MGTKKFNALQGIKKRDAIIVSGIILVSIYASSTLNTKGLLESSALKYLGSALIQSFAALIAIPFAFYASYLHNKYGYTGLQFAIDRVKTHIFPIFSLMAIISIALIMFPNYPDIPKFEIGYSTLLKFLLFTEFSVSALLFLIIYRHLIEVMEITPLGLVRNHLKLRDIWSIRRTEKHNFKCYDLFKTFRETLELLKVSLRDPTLHPEAEEILSEISLSFRTFLRDYSQQGNFQVFSSSLNENELNLLYNVLAVTRTNFVGPLKKSGATILEDNVNEFIEALSEFCFALLIKQNARFEKSLPQQRQMKQIKKLQESYKILNLTLSELSEIYFKNYYNTAHNGINNLRSIMPYELREQLQRAKTYLIQEEYRYLMTKLGGIHSPSRKLEFISEFQFLKPFYTDDDLLKIYLQDIISDLNVIHKYPTKFIKLVTETMLLAKDAFSEEELVRILCPIVSSITLIILNIIMILLQKDPSYEILLERAKSNLVDPSRILFEKTSLSLRFTNKAAILSCSTQSENIGTSLEIISHITRVEDKEIIIAYIKKLQLDKFISVLEN